MNPLDMALGWLQDLWHLPVVFKLFLLGAAGIWLKKRFDHHRSVQFARQAAAWPTMDGSVVWAQVVEEKRSRGEDSVTCWVGVLTYSYFVNEIEVGEYRRDFQFEAEADEWARSIRDTKIHVHVNPADPKQSCWVADEAAAALSAATAAAAADAAGTPLTGAFQGMRFVLLAASTFGALAALAIHLGILLGRPIVTFGKNGPAFFALHIGAIACAALTGALMARRFPGRADQGDWFARGSARTFIRILGAYTTIMFAYGWVRGAANGDRKEGFDPTLMFSAAWLLLFCGACIACWSAGLRPERSSELAPP